MFIHWRTTRQTISFALVCLLAQKRNRACSYLWNLHNSWISVAFTGCKRSYCCLDVKVDKNTVVSKADSEKYLTSGWEHNLREKNSCMHSSYVGLGNMVRYPLWEMFGIQVKIYGNDRFVLLQLILHVQYRSRISWHFFAFYAYRVS